MNRPISVLKFGSSVLTDGRRILEVGREIVRTALSHHVVAVVSALPGRTDELMGAARALSERSRGVPDPHLLAGLLATGEDASVALVAMAVREVGGTVRTQTSAELALRTEGACLDAEPVDFDPSRIRAALDRGEAVVVPGFVGRDSSQRPTVLGRGGSDLTALFLATRLEADECRLFKDVDGLYTTDPRESPDARRYLTATWRRALEVGNQVVQPKAVRFAERLRIEFSITALEARRATRVGLGPDLLALEDEARARVPC